MTRIVRTHYRYKRPPRKRAKAAALEVPAIVTISEKTRKRVASDQPSTRPRSAMLSNVASALPQRSPAVAQRLNVSAPDEPPPANDDRRPAIVQAKKPRRVSVRTDTPERPTLPDPEDRKSAIVTARRPGKRRYADVPEVSEEEHRDIGDRADAMMQAFKRQIAEKLRK